MQACVDGCLSPCRDTGMYYGGEPAAWTTQPEMIPEALFGNANTSAGTYGPNCRTLCSFLGSVLSAT